MQNQIPRALGRRASAAGTAVPAQPGGYLTSFPYHSTVMFRAPLTGGNSYPFALGSERKAFGYASGQEWETAGATTAIDGRATDCETNLTKPAETTAGESVEIQGIAVQVLPGLTDGVRFPSPRLLAMIATNVHVDLIFNGGQSHKLGTIGMIPGAGGLLGQMEDVLNDVPQPFSFMQNGWQTRSNMMRVPEGILWRPAGEVDSLMQVVFTVKRAFTLYVGGDIDRQQQPEVAAPYLACALKVHIIGRQTSERSKIV